MHGLFGEQLPQVASDAAREAREYLASHAAVGEHLTDQLLLPMALAGGGCFAALKINLHARTNMEVIGKFLAVRFTTAEMDGYTKVEIVS